MIIVLENFRILHLPPGIKTRRKNKTLLLAGYKLSDLLYDGYSELEQDYDVSHGHADHAREQ